MKYTKELLQDLVSSSTSYSEVLRKLGKYPSGGIYTHIKYLISKYGIATNHFIYKYCLPTGPLPTRSINHILSTGKIRRESAKVLRKALLSLGYKYECVICTVGDNWNGKRLILEIDHINGDWSDCSEHNLRFVCPNCHSQLTRELLEVRYGKKKSELDPQWRHRDKLVLRKVDRPSKDELNKLLWAIPTKMIAKNLGVADKTIEKWAKRYGLSKPPRGYWQKKVNKLAN